MNIPGEHEMEFRLGSYPRQKTHPVIYPDHIPRVRRMVVIQSPVILTVGGKPWNLETRKILENSVDYGVKGV